MSVRTVIVFLLFVLSANAQDPPPVQKLRVVRQSGTRRAPTRITKEQYEAFAAQYEGASSVKLLRFEESERPYNAAMVADMIALAAVTVRTNEPARIQYYGGISHTLGGVVPEGAAYTKDVSVPPPKGYYHEFHYDREGRVQKVVGHEEDGTAHLTDVVLYENGRPYVRLSYGNDGQLGYAYFVYYRDGKPYLWCNVSRDGTVAMELMTPPSQ